MKTLKKTLSLVLVIAMVLSLGLVSVYATDFTDDDQITQKEAVEVMTGIGVINGMGDGTFAPAGSFTREQAAKIIAYMLLTPAVADSLTASEAPFDDVAADRWSAPYVSYAASQGIIAGYGDGNFGPADELTAEHWLKMLLVTVGFDAKENGLEGQGWDVNTKALAMKSKLVTSEEVAMDFNRETAVVYAYDALKFSEAGETTVYKVGGKAYADAVDAYVVSSITGLPVTMETTYPGSLATDVYGLKDEAAVDPYGREAAQITNGKEGAQKEVYYSKDATPVASYEGPVKAGKIATDLGYSATKTGKITKVIEDGQEYAVSIDLKKGDTTDMCWAGAKTEIYKGENKDEYTAVIINTYAYELKKTDITAAKPATKDTDAEPAFITVDGLDYETDAFKAGDVILYTEGVVGGNPVIVNVVKAPSFNGSVTALGASNAYVKIEGEQYELSDNAICGAIGTDPMLKISDDQNSYFTDDYGYIVAAKAGEAAAVPDNYIWLKAIKASEQKGAAGDTLFDDPDPSSFKVQAQVIDLTTGEVKVVDVALTQNSSKDVVLADRTGAPTSAKAKDVVSTPITINGYVKYVANEDGTYAFNLSAETTKSVTLKKGVADIGGILANSKTVATVLTGNKTSLDKCTSFTVATYTGIANFPKELAADALVVTDPDGIATSVIIIRAAAPSVAKTNYAIYAGEGETDAKGTKLAFITAAGEKVEYYDGGVSVTKDSVYDITVSDGKVTAATLQSPAKSGEIETIDETYVSLKDGTVIYLKSGYSVLEKPAYAKGELEVGATITVYGKDVTKSTGGAELIIVG